MKEQDYTELNQQTYVKEAALTLWEGLPGVILAGLLFSLACLPALIIFLSGFFMPAILLGIFTISPAWAALNAQVAQVIYREPASIATFLGSFGKNYRRSLPLGAMMAVPLSAASLTMPLLAEPPVPVFAWVGLAADFSGIFLLSCLFLYAYPMIVLHEVKVGLAMRNSLVLAARYLWNTLGLIAMAVLLGWLAVKVSYLLLVLFPACWLVFVINNSRMVLRLELGDAA